MASQGSAANSGARNRNTTRNGSPRRAASCTLAVYRPYTRSANTASNSCWPTSRTGSSCADSLPRVGTAEASTADASSRLRLSSFSASSRS